jgi:hypothetical protein
VQAIADEVFAYVFCLSGLPQIQGIQDEPGISQQHAGCDVDAQLAAHEGGRREALYFASFDTGFFIRLPGGGKANRDSPCVEWLS